MTPHEHTFPSWPKHRTRSEVPDCERMDATRRAVSLKGGDRVLTPDGVATVRYHKDIGRIVGVQLNRAPDVTVELHPWNVEPYRFTTSCGCDRYPCPCTGCDCDGTFHTPGPTCPGQEDDHA